MLKPVLTKRDFVRRYERGEFGNRSPTWSTLEDWIKDRKPNRLYHVRNRIAGEKTWYNVPTDQVPIRWTEATSEFGTSQLYISEMAPTELTLFQGEVKLEPSHQGSPVGTYLRYTTVKMPMRDALREEEMHAEGVLALGLLHLYLDPTSYEWLQHLLNSYPEHIIEFSTYATNWGTIPSLNTVIWEVRKY